MDSKSPKVFKLFFKYLFYPFTICAAVGTHFVLQPELPPFLKAAGPSMVAVAVMIWVCCCEQLQPFHKPWTKSQGDVSSDFLYTLVLLPLAMKAGEQCASVLSHSLLPQQYSEIWPQSWPLPVTVFVGILGAEFFFYWIHRSTHENNFLWKYHELHHSAKRLYWLNSGRLHGIDAFLNFFFYTLPLALTGFPKPAFLIFLTLTMTTGVLEHANVNFRAGLLNLFFNTAELHRWHHALRMEISKKNYGKISCFWDLVFGTYYNPKCQDQITEIGVAD